MRRYLSHELGMDATLMLSHRAKTYLAIVDLASYLPLIGPHADHLDLLGHLCGQTEALHAVMWETPAEKLNLKIQLTADVRLSNELLRTHRLVFDGCVRTLTGQLCLTDDEQLLAAARREEGDLLNGRRVAEDRCPQVLHVPAGVISVGVFCGRSSTTPIPELESARIDYTILMRHYPLPPPRVAPVRITGGLIPWAGEVAAGQPWGGQFSE